MSGLFAVVDLGSNSCRLLIARQRGDQLQIVERMKTKVQLARDLRDGLLHPAAIARARSCLERYAQRLAGMPRDRIALVGTHALRVSRNSAEVVAAAESILGVPLRILSGEEEATLIFRGVQQHEPNPIAAGRLVIDIGGGSTEFAWGGAERVAAVRSIPYGCVSIGDRFFRRDLPLDVAFDAARAHLDAVLADLGPVGGDVEVLGTSGTVESAQAVLLANGWGQRTITAGGLGLLIEALSSGPWDAEAGLIGLAPERIDIFPSGIVLLDTLVRRMGITSMRYVEAALEDGVLYDLIQGEQPVADVRAAAVRGLQERFGIDVEQARRVRKTALALFDQAAAAWPEVARDPAWRALLATGADLHELGLSVTANAHHRHGAYLLRHADLRGIAAIEREQLALLVRGHRRRFPVLAFASLAPDTRRPMIRLTALLRLAVVLERSHANADSPSVRLAASGANGVDRLHLWLPRGWLAQHPLSRQELADEQKQLADAGIRLIVAES